MDITALQEIRWKGKEEIKDITRRQCDLYYSYHPSKHEFGVGFGVGHLSKKGYACSELKTNFTSAYFALTEDANVEVKDFFYEQLDKAYSTIPAYDMKMILRD